MCLVLVSLLFSSCLTTKEEDKMQDEAQAAKIENDNNVSQSAYKTEIVDWDGRTLGEPRNPSWLKKLIRGNANEYCDAYGLEASKTRKFIIPTGAYDVNLENARNEANLQVAYAVGKEMAMHINAVMGSDLTDGQKDQVQTICSRVNVDITGLRLEGEYWQLEKTTDDRGNITKKYLAYAFYSMSKSKYNELLNLYLVDLLRSKDIDRTAVNEIKSKAVEILEDAQKTDERMERRKAEEQQRLLAQYDLAQTLSNNETAQLEAQERTKQVKSHNEAAAKMSGNEANAETASQATISPALASILRSS